MRIREFRGQKNELRAPHDRSVHSGKEMLGTRTHLMPNARRMLSLPDGMNLNQELVRQGWCWWYRKYGQGDTELEGLGKAAEARLLPFSFVRLAVI